MNSQNTEDYIVDFVFPQRYIDLISTRTLEVAAGLRRLIESALVCDREEVEISFEDVGAITISIIRDAMRKIGVRCIVSRKEKITTFKLNLKDSKVCNDIRDKLNSYLWDDDSEFYDDDDDEECVEDEYEDEESY